ITLLPVGAACSLLVAGGALGPPYQTALWAAALLVDYSGIWISGTSGWRLPSAAHFAERHGLIVIIALGESIVATGVGVAQEPVTWAIVVAALLALAVSVALWWTYFDVVALVAERVLAGLTGEPRSRLGRDSYTYLHFPMVAGVIYLALGLKKVLTYVADTEHHDLGDPLGAVALTAMFGGVAAYLIALSALRRRNLGSWNVARLVVGGALLAVLPVGAALPALGALALVAALVIGLIAYEAVHHAEARRAVRHPAPH
ncbi:MAG: low temperature requirement protein A, partial [Actinomycetes bacterium]